MIMQPRREHVDAEIGGVGGGGGSQQPWSAHSRLCAWAASSCARARPSGYRVRCCAMEQPWLRLRSSLCACAHGSACAARRRGSASIWHLVSDDSGFLLCVCVGPSRGSVCTLQFGWIVFAFTIVCVCVCVT